jgi:hypothetical protein
MTMQGGRGWHSGSGRDGRFRNHEAEAAVCLLDSVVAHAFLAGLALYDVHPSGPEAASIDRALGQLEEILREARAFAFQRRSADTRVRPLGPDSADRSGAR